MRLDLFDTLVFGASGAGQLRFGPVPTNERWTIQRYVTFCKGFGCTAVLYRNWISQTNCIDDTLSGESDIGGIQINLQAGEALIFDYASGVTGDNVSAHLEGIRRMRGRRAY